MKYLLNQITKDHLINLINTTDTLLSFVDKKYIYRVVNTAYTHRLNRTMDKIVGYSVEEILGKESFITLVKPNLDKAFAGEKVHYESWFETPNTARAYLIVSYIPSYREDGKIDGAIVSVVDHTVIKLNEQEKQKHDSMMVEISKMVQLGEMVAFLSHQWRRPLNTLATYLLKIRILAGKNIMVEEALDRSEGILETLSSDIETMYALYSNELTHDETHLHQSLLKVVDMVRERIKAHDITISINVPDTLIVLAAGDELIHVLLVVIENAIDSLAYINSDKKQLSVQTILEKDHLVIEICDNGSGITFENINHIFDPGFTTKLSEGQGYGLYFARKIIMERLSGSIEGFSDPLGGKFHIRLPYKLVIP